MSDNYLFIYSNISKPFKFQSIIFSTTFIVHIHNNIFYSEKLFLGLILLLLLLFLNSMILEKIYVYSSKLKEKCRKYPKYFLTLYSNILPQFCYLVPTCYISYNWVPFISATLSSVPNTHMDSVLVLILLYLCTNYTFV